MQKHIVLLFTLAVTTGVGFAQTSPPTGIQKSGVIALNRGERKTFPASGPAVETITDTAVGAFSSIDLSAVTLPDPGTIVSIGPCNVTTFTITGPPVFTIPPIKPLDAGPALNVNGPNGAKQIASLGGVGYISNLGGGAAPLYLDPGTYTIDNGAGGADVGPFMVTLNVPSPGLAWTNADANLTIDRSAGVEIQWTGGDPTTTVTIAGAVSSPTQRALFACLVPNNGDFVVTSDVLSLLPASPTGPGTLSTLSVLNATQVSFSASGIDMGNVTYASSAQRTVVYQ
jgi:hypothetical protein